MTSHRRFRVLTPEGLLSQETFVLPPVQPHTIKPGCVLVVDEQPATAVTTTIIVQMATTVPSGPVDRYT